MVAINLKGNSLGRRHQHYNKLLKEALENNPPLEKIQPSDNDINNLFRIDIACRKHDVEYVMEVLRSDDMLYVSRAIKRSPWLIRDPKYTSIINPEHLHDLVLPQMTSKAVSKFLLTIRLNLKDETRVEEFYKYYKDKDINFAMKWLPLCSEAVILKEVELFVESQVKISISIFKRLCERSFKVLEIFVRNISMSQFNYVQATMFLLNSNTTKFLDIFETLGAYKYPKFSKKFTGIIMERCPERIIDNFEKYYDKIDLREFAKYFKNADVKAFLLKQLSNKEILSSWFKFGNIKYFVKYLPRENRFDFLKKVFIEKQFDSGKDESEVQKTFADIDNYLLSLRRNAPLSSAIYIWYRFAQFEVAFIDLKTFITIETNPVEKDLLLKILIVCATSLNNIQKVLQYYHDEHINEPLNHKIQFVNSIVSMSKTHEYDEETWHLLNNIFCGVGVYNDESDTDVQKCIQAIIVYKVIHHQKIPDIIDKKFCFDTLKSIRVKLFKSEQERVFKYLYNTIVHRLDNRVIQSDADLEEAIELLNSALGLLVDWDQQLSDYPLLINKIKSFVELKVTNVWKADLSCLYKKHKSWRKHLFEFSIALLANEEVCINALKHNTDLLGRYFHIVESLSLDDRVSLYKLLSKIRVYWPESLYDNWVGAYQKWLSEPKSTGYAAIVRGLCTLLPRHQIIPVARQYITSNTKVTYTEENNSLLCVSNQFAKNFHLVRPIPTDIVFLFSNSQHAMPSLSSVMCTVSSANKKEIISKILNSPVALQKYSIRIAIAKSNAKEIKDIFSQTWQTTKMSSIRAFLFKQTFALMSRERNDSNIKEIFALISDFVKHLSTEENKIIYSILGEVDKVPKCVRAKYFMMSYSYLKTSQPRVSCEDIRRRLLYYSVNIVEDLDSDFIEKTLLGCNDTTNMKYYNLDILATYLVCARDVNIQTQRYEKVLVDWLTYTCSKWDEGLDEMYNANYNMKTLLQKICGKISEKLLEINMLQPAKLLEDILNYLEITLSTTNNYVLFRFIKLAISYVNLLDEHRYFLHEVWNSFNGSRSPKTGLLNYDILDEIHLKVAKGFAAVCIDVLNEDVNTSDPSVYKMLAQAMSDVLDCFTMSDFVRLTVLKNILDGNLIDEGYLFVLEAMPDKLCVSDEGKPLMDEILEKLAAHNIHKT